MAGTVTGTIGNNAGVLFTYAGNTAAMHLDIGFQPSRCYFESATTTLSWSFFAPGPYARVATAASSAQDTGGGVGRQIGTVTSTASIQGIQIGTDTTINAGVTYRGMCWR